MANAIDKTQELISYANSNRNKISKIIINSILIFIIFAISGCFDFANFRFDITLIMSMQYWTNVMSKTICGSIAFNIGINLLFDKEVDADQELSIQRAKYKRINAKKNEALFNNYVENVFNPEQKKQAYISSVNRKIYWLNKFARNKDKLLYSSDREEEKLTNRYCIKRKELEELKSEEYINKNLKSIVVKYTKIDPIIFELEIDGSGTYKGIKTKGDVRVGRAKLTSGVVMGMVSFSMIITSIVLAPDQQEFANQMVRFWHYVLSFCTDTGIILWQMFRGMINTRKLVSQELTEPLVGRNRVLDSYFQWVVDECEEPTKGQQLAKLVGEGDMTNV